MGYEDLQFSADDAPSVEVKRVAARTKVRSDDQDAHLDKNAGGVHHLQFKNLLSGGMVFDLTSSHDGTDAVYGGAHPSTWDGPFVVNKPRDGLFSGGAKWVERHQEVQHPGACVTGTVHHIRISGKVRSANPAENIAYTAQDFHYQYTCKC